MRTLVVVQTIFAASALLVGFVALFGLGITGLIILVPGFALVFVASLTQTRSRAAVVLALAVDAVTAYFAAAKLHALLSPQLHASTSAATVAAVLKPTMFDYLVPSAALALIAVAAIAVLLDWRAVRAASWF